ncbi:MAG: acetoacetate decarboxylase family protein [bacterium]|nr:acetoacetate decarboxylase family protein [bacterium]
MMIFYLVSSKRMAEFVPAPLEVAEVLPGVTLGGLYAAFYETGDFGALSEFSVSPALVRYKHKRGFYIPYSMTQAEEGLAQSKGAWGLKKKCARFHWEKQPSRWTLHVVCDGKEITKIGLRTGAVSFPMRVGFSFFHLRPNGVFSYHADYTSRVRIASSAVTIPEDSPLAAYQFRRKLITTAWESTKIVLHAPESEKKIVFAEGASEGIFLVGEDRNPVCGLKKGAEERMPWPPPSRECAWNGVGPGRREF